VLENQGYERASVVVEIAFQLSFTPDQLQTEGTGEKNRC
jgi:hypothetical protein